MLDLKLLQTFREVAVRRSFSGAAEALHLTQPAVSQHVRRLERDLDARLLERDARGVALTAAGEALLTHAEALLAGARRAEIEVRDRAGAPQRAVRLGAFPTAAAGLVPAALRALREAGPATPVELRVADDPDTVPDLAAGRLDVALVIASDLVPARAAPGVEHLHLLDDPMLVALPADHPLAARPSVALADLSGDRWLIPCVGGTCPDSNVILHKCRAAGFAPDVELELDDYQTLLALAATGVGVALIPTLATHGLPADVVLRPVRGQAPVRRVLAAVREGERDGAVERVLAALRTAGAGLFPRALAAA
jgi:DNA-binding transcriptional LysR family regulator